MSRTTGLAVAMGFLVATSAAAQEKEAPKVDEKAGTVSFSAKAANNDKYEQLKGAIEFVIVMTGGKEYESCFVAPVDALKLHEGLKKIGAKPGKPAADEKTPATGGKLKISVKWKDGDKEIAHPIEKFVLDEETKKPMENVQWLYQGSKEGFVPETGDMGLIVQSTKNLMGLYQGESAPLITNPLPLMTGHRYKVNKALLPKEGTALTIVMEAVK